MDIKKILLGNGISEDLATNCADALKREIPKEFVSKTQYKKKSELVDELNGKIADLEIQATKGNTDEYKTKYAELEKEYNDYKTGIETKETNRLKTNKITEMLKKEGANEGVLNLLTKAFDLSTVEIENDNIKDWENVLKPVKEQYSGCFATTTTTGNPPATPPQGNITKFTLDNINNMSASEIAKNYDKIRRDLNS